ncbi:MAG: serine/threonine protein kinase [Bryobacterales bacterium]|nr:serine/threonine protein kinase [Bryobacterales bacterium]
MDRDRFTRIEALFHEASELPDAEREPFLDRECGGDPELRSEVESLLAAAGDTGSVRRAIQGAAVRFAAGPRSGQMAGPYRMLRPIGQGGMGTVWLAERADEAYTQQVAIKFAHWQVKSEAFADRLRGERQILASLDHPNIARLLDGGSAEDGTPYVVMEYVDGQPILTYCEQRALGLRERLALFLKLCAAVASAHQNLVVHRDIKPSNVLVTQDGEPKLLDFGIAKLLESDDASPTLTGARLLTPDYASPEQIAGAGVTTAADVYSLGVLLYELLAGENPFRRGSTSQIEIIRRVCDTEPAQPSAIAAQADRNFARQVAGDLDSIVLKALRKEPAGRFSTVEQFAQDIRRFLDGYPVEARRGAWAYRTRKFILRNRTVTALGTALVVSLLGFGIGMAALARQAARERDAAEEMSQFLVGVFTASTPSSARGRTVTAREILDSGAARVTTTLRDKPALQARMLVTLGNSFLSLGILDRARELGEEALHLHTTVLPQGTADHAEALSLMGNTWLNDLERAGGYQSQALEIRKRLFPPGHPSIANSTLAMGSIARLKGDHETAERLNREAAGQLERSLGLKHQDTITALNQLGTVLRYRGKREESANLRRQALEASEALFGLDHPQTVDAISNLATDLAADGNYAEAEPLIRRAVALNRKIRGEAHPKYADALGNLGAVLALSGQHPEAEGPFREALEVYGRAGLAEQTGAGRARHNLSRVLLAKGDIQDAERMCREAISTNTRALGPNHPEIAQYTDTLGILLRRQNRFQEGAATHRKALGIRRAALRPGHPGIAVSLVGLGAALTETGRPGAAEPFLREALEIREAGMAPGQWEIAEARSMLGYVLLLQRRYAEAEPLLAQALSDLEATRGPSSPEATAARDRLARLHREWRKP